MEAQTARNLLTILIEQNHFRLSPARSRRQLSSKPRPAQEKWK
jgi:hypothetical protein